MVTAALVDNLIEDGKLLVQALDETGIDVQAALWFYDSDSEDWRLLIASHTLQAQGPLGAYATIQTALDAIPHQSLALSGVRVISPDDPLIKALRMAIRTGPGIAGIRFSRNVIDHVFIEDAYIYRVL
jgi:hypothetical protein